MAVLATPISTMMKTTYFTKSLKGSNRFELAATREMVVLSPPGKMSASHRSNSRGVRTSMNSHCEPGESCDGVSKDAAAFFSKSTCSTKAPCKARTPTVIVFICIVIDRKGEFESRFRLSEKIVGSMPVRPYLHVPSFVDLLIFFAFASFAYQW